MLTPLTPLAQHTVLDGPGPLMLCMHFSTCPEYVSCCAASTRVASDELAVSHACVVWRSGA